MMATHLHKVGRSFASRVKIVENTTGIYWRLKLALRASDL